MLLHQVLGIVMQTVFGLKLLYLGKTQYASHCYFTIRTTKDQQNRYGLKVAAHIQKIEI
jgi:hypothetical protein